MTIPQYSYIVYWCSIISSQASTGCCGSGEPPFWRIARLANSDLGLDFQFRIGHMGGTRRRSTFTPKTFTYFTIEGFDGNINQWIGFVGKIYTGNYIWFLHHQIDRVFL
jgi:hypothetical protein